MRFLGLSFPLIFLLGGCASGSAPELPHTEAQMAGTLRVHPSNPRYFTDDSGQAVYLTGSHTWDNFQDWVAQPSFDYEAYLNLLVTHYHNFIRLWTWEDARVRQSPYARPGPGLAADGRPKFDVDQFDQAYFDRLRMRVLEAQERGLYVAVVLFQHHGDWDLHPFNGNNVNGIEAETHGEVHTLAIDVITARQRAYVRKVIDTINDLDNVLYEIGNEHGRQSLAWIEEMAREIRTHQASKPQQHLVGISASGAPDRITNAELLMSSADWIAPSNEAGQDYAFDPPPATGRKVVVVDQDHIGHILGTADGAVLRDWVWTSFMRGLHPITMEAVQNGIPGWEGESWNDVANPAYPAGRQAMGLARALATEVDLAAVAPEPEACSTGYCLVETGQTYLIYVPERDASGAREQLRRLAGRSTIWVDLSEAPGPMCIEWMDARTAAKTRAEDVQGGTVAELVIPFAGPAVLYAYAAETSRLGDDRQRCRE